MKIVITDSMNMNLNKLQEIAEDRGTSKAHGIAKSWTWISDWTPTYANIFFIETEYTSLFSKGPPQPKFKKGHLHLWK